VRVAPPSLHGFVVLAAPTRRLMRAFGLARLAWLVLGYNLAVILWGAFVRATGSGAGCGAHWPLCNGEVLPRAGALETLVEFTHRATSGVALLAVFWLAWRVFRAKPRGHPARAAAGASVLFILSEAAVGAGLVLFRLVADNESVARALFMAAHLTNTFVLLACLTLTAHWSSADALPRRSGLASPLALAAAALLAVGTSGAVAALGDTLYPARSLLGALAADLSPTAHVLVRLRLAHPLLSLLAALAVAAAAAAVLRASTQPAARFAAWRLVALTLLQLAVGLANVALLAPVWMQLVHLLLADLVWISFVLMAVNALSATGTRA
jgi:cytochrome c oxidase assembly protein subunit 15